MFVVVADGPPTGVRTTRLMSSSVVVMWDQSPSSDVSGYRVSYSTGATYVSESDRMNSVMVGGRVTLEKNTPYTITVQADSSDGLSINSDVVSILTLTAGK